ncbi:MAG: hypothetical protein J2P17_11705 [Mycobacterium sp.]|nr:hypothetical protein [Mycobacterium sp.]
MRELTGDDVVAGREVRRVAHGAVEVVVPWDQVARWRVACECGWTGSEQPAQTSPRGERHCDAFPEIENAFSDEWSDHVAPYTAVHDLEQLLNEQRELEARIKDTVQRARQAGASWPQIGRAAGITKQGAQHRWGKLSTS